jgi:hypothetical protein
MARCAALLTAALLAAAVVALPSRAERATAPRPGAVMGPAPAELVRASARVDATTTALYCAAGGGCSAAEYLALR